MRCNNCGREIEENEIFCYECKNKLKLSSSRGEVSELEKLIEEQKKLNDLEVTKELNTLDNLESISLADSGTVDNKSEEILDKSDQDDLTRKIDLTEIYHEESVKDNEEKKLESREERNKIQNELKRKKTTKIIIIVSIIVVVLIIIMSIAILLLNKNTQEIVPEVDYNKVINEYGSSVKKIVLDYKTKNQKIPIWEDVSDLINYTSHNVDCEIREIYADGNIYLDMCKIDDESIKYTYGKKQEEIKEGKKITIYKNNDVYGLSEGKEVGKITCKTEECEHISSYDIYSIIKDEGKYYIYNYQSDSIIFGPFDLEEQLCLNNKLYAVMYKEDGLQNMYSLALKRTFKNIKGTLDLGNDNQNNIIYKYGYVIFKDGNRYNFVNLKTGNISYYIEGKSLEILKENTKNNLLYMILYDLNDKIKIYNNNGKLLFEQDYIKIKMYDNYFIFSNDTSYSIYDSNLNLKVHSKKYDKILGIYEDFIAVLNKNHLEVVDFNDKVIITYTDEWKETYEFREELSGLGTRDEQSAIYLKVVDKEISSGTLGYVREYYYIKSTKESGVLEANSLN